MGFLYNKLFDHAFKIALTYSMSLKKNYTTKERFAILEKVTTELYVAMHKLQLQINELQPKEIVKKED